MDIAFLLDLSIRLLITGVIIFRNKSSAPVRLSWVIVVLLLPFIGAVFYLLFGEIWREKGRLARHKSIINKVRTEMASMAECDTSPSEITNYSLNGMAKNFELHYGFSLREGNQWKLFSDSSETIRGIASDIDNAEHSCHLLFYIWLDDHSGNLIANALIRATTRGVKCSVLVDGLGSSLFLSSSLRKRMVEEGIQIVIAFPLPRFNIRFDHRNHRKIIVIDGKIGWTGSQNIADAEFRIKPKFAPWVDVMIRIEGPVVHDLQTVFIEDWLLEENSPIDELATAMPNPVAGGSGIQIFPSGPTIDFRVTRQTVIASIFLARRELILTTPYFVPDDASLTAYCALARTGVRTVLILPEKNDSKLVAFASRSYYRELLDAGVEIYEYKLGLLHSKTMTIDGKWSSIDTANFDRRSFELNYEISLSVWDESFTSQLRDIQMSYICDSERINKEQWINRAAYRRFYENTARLLAPIL